VDLEKIYDRTEIVLGKEKLEILKKSHVVICGIGGVGSYTLEALARIGVGHITVVDKDVVDVTNINRQIIATVDNVGNSK
jgi:tRNA A37 threonylcarbamoyladenosine dehydratase